VEVISSIYNSGYNIKKFYLGSRELNLAYLGNQVIYDEVIGDNDLNYILYEFYGSDTLPNTVEAPVKSAILKGQTLVNVIDYDNVSLKSATKENNGVYTLQWGKDIDASCVTPKLTKKNLMKPNTKYLLAVNILENNTGTVLGLSGVGAPFTITSNSTKLFQDKLGWQYKILTSNDQLAINLANCIYFGIWQGGGDLSTHIKFQFMMFEYQDGMENWDIPYFEGMQSVKMPVLTVTGKNLFDVSKKCEGYILVNSTHDSLGKDTLNTWTTHWVKAKPNTRYTIKGGNRKRWQLKSYSEAITYTESETIMTLSDTEYIRCYYCNEGYEAVDVQLEEGDTSTSYESFKSNILTVNEEIELRGIGDVRDELNCLTGEVVQRVGEIVLDGSEDWVEYDRYPQEGYTAFIVGVPTLNNYYDNTTPFASADFPTGTWPDYKNNLISEFVWNHDPVKIGIRVKNEIATDVNGIKAFLSANNIKINYKLATSVVKTVDLTIVDQDGKTINKLNSFNGTTHVSTEVAENSTYPMVSLEVASELQAAMSKVAVDVELIKPVQNDIETTIDTQSNDIDSLLLATTELFEMFL
jgi:hypothetical protein